MLPYFQGSFIVIHDYGGMSIVDLWYCTLVLVLHRQWSEKRTSSTATCKSSNIRNMQVFLNKNEKARIYKPSEGAWKSAIILNRTMPTESTSLFQATTCINKLSHY